MRLSVGVCRSPSWSVLLPQPSTLLLRCWSDHAGVSTQVSRGEGGGVGGWGGGEWVGEASAGRCVQAGEGGRQGGDTDRTATSRCCGVRGQCFGLVWYLQAITTGVHSCTPMACSID